MAQQPKKLTSKRARAMARAMRDDQWRFAERVASIGTLWLCWWNKNGHHDCRKPLPDDLWVCGLIDGMELLAWLHSHMGRQLLADWWVIGEWSDARYAAPVTITDAGRAAIANRDAYDMEPVTGSLVEPGWQAIPLPPTQGGSRAHA